MTPKAARTPAARTPAARTSAARIPPARASAARTAPARRAASKGPAKKGKAAPPATAKELLKHLKPASIEARTDAPTPLKGKAKTTPARKAGAVSFKRDAPLPLEANAAKLLKELKDQKAEFHPSQGKGTFEEDKFDEFFSAEIETEVERPAEIVHDRIARWRCQCCDALIPVPRRTTVYHGDYVLEHDDVLGLLVNGERWVPKAETPLEVVQPGRLRDPWTGDLLRPGKRAV